MSLAASAAVRPGTSADAILGALPKEVFSPGTVEEAAAVLEEIARTSASVAFVGGGTALGLGRPPRRLDAVLRTEHLTRIVEHAPSDQIIVVESGITLAELQRAVAAHRQRLALDPPLPERSTIGGLLATNGFGQILLGTSWPNVPPGLSLVLQAAIADPLAPAGAALSNAVIARTQ